MNLPFPKSRAGIFVSLVLIPLLYCFYYWSVYRQLDLFYEGQFVDISYKLEANPNTPDLTILAKVPKYTSRFVPTWIYGTVTNNSDKEQKVTISFSMLDEEILLLPSMYSGGSLSIFQRSSPELTIEPQAKVSFRLPLVGAFSKNDNEVLYINQLRASSDTSTKPETDDKYTLQALKRVVVENLFLPPWANTILPLFVLVMCYLAENEWGESQGINIISVVYISVYSLITMLLCYGLMEALLWDLSLQGIVEAWFLFLLVSTGINAGNGGLGNKLKAAWKFYFFTPAILLGKALRWVWGAFWQK